MTQQDVSAEAEAQQDGQQESTEATQERTDFNSLPADVQARIRELTKEAEKYRKDKAAIERQRKADEEARLAQNQEFEKLATGYKTELDALKPRAERLDAMETFLTESAQKRIAALPKQYQSLVPEYDDPLKTLAWLDANASVLGLQALADTGAGQTGDRAAQVKLTPEEERVIAKTGVSREKYIEQKKRQGLI